MVLFDLVKDKKDLISKDHMEAAASQLISKMRGGVIKKKDNNPELSFDKEESEIEEKGTKMLQVMDWAFDKANGSIPGFGTSAEMAERFLSKYGGVSEAISHLVNWQITSAATAGFVTSLGGLATMPLTLPANIAGVLAIQLRMVGAIADLGGMHENTEEKKTGMYLCLLGAEAGDILSKTAGQFAVKFTTASLKKLPGAALTKINQAVGFRLFTKFGTKGLVNINRMIPVLGGVVGGTVDAFSTYGIAQAAKSIFLNDIINFERQEQIDIAKIRLLINLALVDNEFSDEESDVLKLIVSTMNLSEKAQMMLYSEIDNPHKTSVDLKLFKDDAMNSLSLMDGLVRAAKADNDFKLSEKLYLSSLAKSLNFSDEEVTLMLNS